MTNIVERLRDLGEYDEEKSMTPAYPPRWNGIS